MLALFCLEGLDYLVLSVSSSALFPEPWGEGLDGSCHVGLSILRCLTACCLAVGLCLCPHLLHKDASPAMTEHRHV